MNVKEKYQLKSKDMIKVLSNPFYCLEKVEPTFAIAHEPIVTEEEFIKCGVKLIKEIGAESYLKNLLENLKGNYT